MKSPSPFEGELPEIPLIEDGIDYDQMDGFGALTQDGQVVRDNMEKAFGIHVPGWHTVVAEGVTYRVREVTTERWRASVALHVDRGHVNQNKKLPIPQIDSIEPVETDKIAYLNSMYKVKAIGAITIIGADSSTVRPSGNQ